MFKKALKIGAATAVALTGIAAGVAAAQPAAPAGANSGGVGDIVITARKRAESLQKVPVAVTAISGAQLQQQGLRQASDLGRVVPSLTVGNGSASVPTAAVFSLRGQAAGDLLLTLSQPVGLYEDTVNIPHPVGTNSSLFDIQRLEVLKGPQGTLYGRNTTGGAINVITRNGDYSGIHGFGQLEFGNFGDQKYTAAVNLPIIDDVLAIRLAAQHWKRDGYGKSAVTGQKYGGDHDDSIGRLSVRFDPTANFSSTTKVEYADLQTGGAFSTLRGLATTAGSGAPIGEAADEGGSIFPQVDAAGSHLFSNFSQSPNIDKTKVWHVAEDLSWNITDDLKFRSISGYHKVVDTSFSDLDGSSFQLNELNVGVGSGVQPFTGPFNQPQPDYSNYDSYTQEFDLSGHSFGRLDWLIGAFGSTEKGFGGEVPVVIPALTPTLFAFHLVGDPGSIHATLSNEKTDTWAIYTQNDFHLSDRVSLTLGARYTAERESNTAIKYDFDPRPSPTGQRFYCPEQVGSPAAVPNSPDGCLPITQRERATGTSYLASFNFQMTPNSLLYVKTARGFRGGALQFRAPEQPGVKPEFATDYEIGLKSDYFNHRLRANLAAYHTNYTNKQQTLLVSGVGGAPTTILANAADAKIDGFEAELNANPVRGWTVYGSLTYLHGQFDSYHCAPVTAPSTLPPETVGPGNTCPVAPSSASTVLVDASGLPFSDPRWRYSVGSRYEHEVGPGILGGQLDWAWTDKPVQTGLTFDPSMPPALTAEFSKARGLLNGRLDYTLPDQQVTVALFATNLLDKHYQYPGLPSGVLGFATGITAEPRMWGVQLRKGFGAE